ncbi:hypothetical protein CRG98_023867 [Punica granatum]|uniref:Uncharacterized protein n=1 Tax=Punica granatum TaxID=22663 RepID=A0A2I0JHM2_PUNGR|nr:hypothetical protein CRG98_023867 [Punica granatum]
MESREGQRVTFSGVFFLSVENDGDWRVALGFGGARKVLDWTLRKEKQPRRKMSSEEAEGRKKQENFQGALLISIKDPIMEMYLRGRVFRVENSKHPVDGEPMRGNCKYHFPAQLGIIVRGAHQIRELIKRPRIARMKTDY